MEIAISNAVQIMEQHYQNQDFLSLARISKEIVQQNPEHPVAWRFLGIATLFSGGDGVSHLLQAGVLGDVDAAIWLNVFNEFLYHPKGSLAISDFISQVACMRMRKSAYMEYPAEVHIESRAICNAKCSFCPYPTMERRGDKMPDALIDKIIDDLRAIPATLPFTICPFKVNDPFLDRRIFAILDKINKRLPNASLRLFTNGSPLTENVVAQIAAVSNVTHLWISLNESEEHAYETTMQLPFNRTIEKLDRLHKRVEAGFPHAVVVSRVCDRSSADDAFRHFLTKRYPLFKCFLVKRDNWTGQVSTGFEKRVLPTACIRWYELSIMASGKVALCCMDGEGKHVIGDTNTQAVLDIYRSPEYRKLRQYSFSRLAAASPCNECDY